MKRRALALVLAWRLDVVVLAGIALIGYGAGQFHPGLGPVIWGVGLIATVRWGAA